MRWGVYLYLCLCLSVLHHVQVIVQVFEGHAYTVSRVRDGSQMLPILVVVSRVRHTPKGKLQERECCAYLV